MRVRLYPSLAVLSTENVEVGVGVGGGVMVVVMVRDEDSDSDVVCVEVRLPSDSDIVDDRESVEVTDEEKLPSDIETETVAGIDSVEVWLKV